MLIPGLRAAGPVVNQIHLNAQNVPIKLSGKATLHREAGGGWFILNEKP